MLRLVILVVASSLAMELVIWLAVATDARDAGAEFPIGATFAAGISIAVLYPLGGLSVLVRPGLAALLFLLAAVPGFFAGYEDGREGLAIDGLLGLPLATGCALCARWRHVPKVTH